MKVEKTGRFIVGVLVVVVGCSHVWAGWSAPVLLSELNGPNGEIAGSPALSSDGLTIYFHREIASLGHFCIVEAHRETADGPFTSGERVMTELITTGYELIAPWVSQDNLRLYYRERPAAGIPRIKMAERPSTSEAWVPAVRTFDELHVDEANAVRPALTADELTIFFHSTRPGSAGGTDLWMAIRESTEESFGNLRPLYELNTNLDEGGPHISPDGLTLHFHGYNRDGYSGYNIYRTTRPSTIANFGNAELVELPSYESHLEGNPYVAPDEQTIFYSGGVDDERGIWMSEWVEITGVFHVDAVNGDNSNDGLTKESAFATIQYAIDMSADDSTVLVWPGVYNEQVDLKGKAITVQSAGDAAVVQTDTGYAFSFHSGEGAGSVLKNFVIRDSEYGIYLISGSSPTICNLTVISNDYGISAFDGADPNVSNCIFWGNTYGDIFGCEATYSCVQDGSAGEGNIDSYPLFADTVNDDYHLLSERGRYVSVDPTLPPWTEPVHVAELDDGANNSVHPFLSADGLTIYFARYIPSLGHGCIVEAYRNYTEEPFGEQRVVDELANGFNVGRPRLSQDGLRLYYSESTTGSSRIKMAQRGSTSQTWTYVRTFDELHVDGETAGEMSLTGDELQIFFHSIRPGGTGGIDLWTATRTSTEEPFGNIRPLYELNTPENDAGPHVMPDGLTLYFMSNRSGYPTGQIFKATRLSRNETFGNVQYVEFNNNIWVKYSCYVVPDEKTLYYHSSANGIYISHLTEDQWVLDTASSPCVDAGNPVLNPADERMPNGGRVNMGAYGGTGSASMSEWPLDGDINRNGVANLADFAILANDWLNGLPWFGE